MNGSFLIWENKKGRHYPHGRYYGDTVEQALDHLQHRGFRDILLVTEPLDGTSSRIERVQAFKSNFGVRERSNGEIVIDFAKMVERLGMEACADLRTVIDEKFGPAAGIDSLEIKDHRVLVDGMGLERALQIRKLIDETYRISGAAGEKPRVRVTAASDAAPAPKPKAKPKRRKKRRAQARRRTAPTETTGAAA